MKLADRTTRVAGSATMKVGATVDRLRRSGIEVIDFGAGEPDFSTPEAIKAAAHHALDANFTRYTPVAGIADLKRAICDRYKADYGVEYGDAQVIVTAGGKQAQVIVRGLRAVSDFEFEFQMALMNQRLKPQIETVFMMPAEQYTYISSRLIKEVFALGGRVNGLVPELVEERLRQKGLAKDA